MSGGINRLSDRSIKAWLGLHKKAQDAPGMLSDGAGMYLTLTNAGTPVWRIKYRFAGKEKLYAAGTYPDVSLEAARAERESLKARLREGRDPVQARQLSRAMAAAAADNTFSALAADWLSKQKRGWSKIHYDKSSQALERDVLPGIGKLPVSEITPAVVAAVIERIDKRAPDTARKILQHVHAIFRLAQAKGMCRDNPAEPVSELLNKKKRVKHRPALLKWPELGDVLRRAEAARLSPSVRLAHRLCAFSVARISNIVQAEWPEFDLVSDVPTWIIPRSKMKSQDRDHDHKIILGPTIAHELREWQRIIGGKGRVFPSAASDKKHITRESLEKVYRVTLRLEGKHTPHGWRSAFSTLARDNGFERDVVEITLDHIHDNDVVRAYDRGERLEQRVKLMTWWDTELMKAQRGADVLPMRSSTAA